MKRTRYDILKDALALTLYNLEYYSANYTMTEPKDGYEATWHEFNDERNLIEAWLKELTNECNQ